MLSANFALTEFSPPLESSHHRAGDRSENGGWNSCTPCCLPLGTMRAADEEEGDRQDDYQTRHNPQFGEQSLKLVYACSLLDLGGDQ